MMILNPLDTKNLSGEWRAKLRMNSEPDGQMRMFLRENGPEALIIPGVGSDQSLMAWSYLWDRECFIEIGAYVVKRFRRIGIGKDIVSAAVEIHLNKFPEKDLTARPWNPAGRNLFKKFENIKIRKV